jgi:uncharacterized protein
VSRSPGWTAEGRALVAGAAEGEAFVLDEPLSFWGGLDASTGAIVDTRHPQRGAVIRGRVLVMPAGRGSSSSSSVLAEAIRLGNGPAALLMAQADEIVVLGALVVQLLDGTTCPVTVLESDDYGRLRTGDEVRIEATGRVQVRRRSEPPG